jgi:hypothetical protein
LISWPRAQFNLGIRTFLDGIASDPVAIDTTTGGTHTIDYVVNGISGLTSTSTRTVIVAAQQPANDNAASSSSALAPAGMPAPDDARNDNTPLTPLSATGTDATTTAQ